VTRTTLPVRLAAALGASALMLSACGGDGEGATSGDASAATSEPTIGIIGNQEDCDNPVSGGTLTLADYAEARSLDPTKTIASAYSGGTALAAVYDVLVRYNPKTREFEPWLADELQSNDDFTEWTVTLRDDVTFSDGTPLNAEAVVNSVNWYLSNRGFDAGVVGPNLNGVQAADERTVVFSLNKPWATFPSMLGQGIGMIVAPAAIAGPEFTPIGAGPFTLDHYSPAEELVLDARDDYWGGDPHLDQLKFVWLGSDDARWETLQADGADVTVLRDPALVQEARDAGYPGYLTVQSLGKVVMVNSAEARPGADPRVREAIALAIDPEVIDQRVYGGVEMSSKALFPELSRWHSPDVEVLPTDVERAAELVEEAKADGFDGTIGYIGSDSPAGRDLALSLQAMLENAGLTVETELLSTADIIQRVFVTRDYDLSESGLSLTEEDPFQRLYSSFHSESFSNASGYADPELDALITELQGTQGDDRQEVITRIEALFQETLPTVTLSPVTPFFPWQEDVHGIEPINDGMLLFGDAWIGECS
jgi:peptide/nickel transport system substrate-binding protein